MDRIKLYLRLFMAAVTVVMLALPFLCNMVPPPMSRTMTWLAVLAAAFLVALLWILLEISIGLSES